MFLTLANGSRILVVAVGVFNLCVNSRVLILKDCLYVPNIRKETRKLDEGELFLTLADGSRIPIVVVGVFNLCVNSRVLILKDYFYVLNIRRNLISATYLGKHGYCVILKDNAVIKEDKCLSVLAILLMVFTF